jgi:pimeloyl-ACP methyl ester carboxylesterase
VTLRDDPPLKRSMQEVPASPHIVARRLGCATRRSTALAMACLVATACHRPTGRSSSGAVPSESAVPREPPATGRLVDVGGYRLHLDCAGSGAPIVVLLPGSGDFSFDWSLVQPEIARSTRVCSYDRAGSAWSDPGPTPRTMRQEAHELRALLGAASEAPPYVLVGHSLGGLVARTYAAAYSGEVAGMVLVDATHESTQLFYQGKVVQVRGSASTRAVPPVQTMRSSPPRPPTKADLEQQRMNREVFGPPAISPPFDRLSREMQALHLWALRRPPRAAAADDYWAEELRDMYEARRMNPKPLDSLPLEVLAAGATPAPPPGVTEDAWRALNAEKRAQRADLATLSTRGRLVVVEGSGHHIQLDAPEAVVASVRRVLDEVRRARAR